MNLETFLLLVVACFAVNLTPGPSVMLVTSVSAARGFRAASFAVLGMSAGAFLHVLLAASGIAALLATAPLLFTLIQYFGAAYLIYLGIDLLRSRNLTPQPNHGDNPASAVLYFRRGLLVDALNPKIALFFLAFIPQFLQAVENPGFLLSLALGSVFLLTGILVNLSYAWLVAVGRKRISGRYTGLVRRWIPGAVLILLGLRLVWQKV